MSPGPQRVDHGFFEMKWLLRKNLIAGICPGAALDLFAGEGRLLSSLYSGFGGIHAVEKDPEKCLRLLRLPDPALQKKLRVYCMDNQKFIAERLPDLAGINLIDLDSYGNPHPLIRALFRSWQPTRRTALAVTDGARMSIMRGGRIRLQNYQGLLAPAGCGQALPQDLPALGTSGFGCKEYELLVQGFWSELARAYHFTIEDFIPAWKKGKGVFYYGLWIKPAQDQLDSD